MTPDTIKITIILSVVTTVIFLITALLIWLFYGNGLDKLKNPEEYKDKGSTGEQVVYKILIDKFKVPKNQILRNVYVPTENGKTSEIDLLIVSRRGIFVVECKNYAGNIYGDARRKKWIQYVGNKKSFFYNPLMQNRSHAKHLQRYLSDFGELPIIPFITTIRRGNWKIKNFGPDDYLTGYNCHIKDIFENTPTSPIMIKNIRAILTRLTPLSRPNDAIKQNHINNINTK